MHHSDIRPTLGTYTDPRLLDTTSALESLPSITLDSETERQRATGTYDSLGAQLGGKIRPAMQNDSTQCKSDRWTHQAVGRIVKRAS